MSYRLGINFHKIQPITAYLIKISIQDTAFIILIVSLVQCNTKCIGAKIFG